MAWIRDRRLHPWAVAAVARGWSLSYTGSGHLRWQSPAGPVVFTASTMGGGRAWANTRTLLRRHGLAIP